MKTIDLTHITFRPSLIGPEVTQDLHVEIAEAIYQNATTLAEHSLALRLYEKGGEPVEVSDDDVKVIRKAIAPFRYCAQEAINKAIE
jgi:hypothetical protein